MNEHLPNKLFLEKFHLTGKAKSNLSAFCNVLSFRDKLNSLHEMNLSKKTFLLVFPPRLSLVKLFNLRRNDRTQWNFIACMHNLNSSLCCLLMLLLRN